MSYNATVPGSLIRNPTSFATNLLWSKRMNLYTNVTMKMEMYARARRVIFASSSESLGNPAPTALQCTLLLLHLQPSTLTSARKLRVHNYGWDVDSLDQELIDYKFNLVDSYMATPGRWVRGELENKGDPR